ncbi:MAG: BBP7 family outer membrane beta-barrel protein [Pirellulaceae bacterium]|nr:BBP7 family outer membrane beta-barrel protein [Pirellulaceae bacterium]
MDAKRKRTLTPLAVASCVAILAAGVLTGTTAQAQVRMKKPDRGSYQSPTITGRSLGSNDTLVDVPLDDLSLDDLQASEEPFFLQRAPSPLNTTSAADRTRPDILESRQRSQSGQRRQNGQRSRRVRGVNFDNAALQAPQNAVVETIVAPTGDAIATDGDVIYEGVPDGVETYHDSMPLDFGSVDGSCDGCCDAGCDGIGCDAMGCDGRLGIPSSNGFISLSPDRWFGSIDILLMFRRGDRPPPLVTTGPDTDVDTAGELGQDDTRVLVGGDSIFKDVTAGARLTLGTWLDNQQCRSLVLRGWFAGEKNFDYAQNQDTVPVITRPFLNVTDGQTPEQDTQVVAFPNRATGSLEIRGDSNVYGADVSVRQLWYGNCGFSVDLLYGYQFMRLDENLSIGTRSVSLDDDFAPVGSILSIRDEFDVENEFHGGQFGMSSMYRVGCWSFSSLTKVGFGSLARRANLSGQTTTSLDGNTAVDPNGLLVRSTNSGKYTDHTFGWVPEIDLTLGYRRYMNYEVTIGYHVMAMTDALQVSGAIDPTLSVNLSDPPTGQQRPTSGFRHDTFYVQGIHFGLQRVY